MSPVEHARSHRPSPPIHVSWWANSAPAGLIALCALTALPAHESARAQAPARPDAQAGAGAVVAAVADPSDAARLLDRLSQRRDAAAVAALSDFLRQGQPDALTDRALVILGLARSPLALPVLGELSHHRRASARRAAYASIALNPDPGALALLGQGLRDDDAAVRAGCARALGERHAKEQLEPLFLAFERGVPEAGIAIGQLADPPAVTRLHSFLERAALPSMLGAYEALLLRPDMKVATKLDIIARLGELSTPGVKAFLSRLMTGGHDWSQQLEVLRALATTAQRIDTRSKPAQATTP